MVREYTVYKLTSSAVQQIRT